MKRRKMRTTTRVKAARVHQIITFFYVLETVMKWYEQQSECCPHSTTTAQENQRPCDEALLVHLLTILLGYLWDQNDNCFQPTQEESVVMQIKNCIYWNFSILGALSGEVKLNEKR
ncbi:hypothetical protein TNCV_4011861 [Trichonephila clavipes]|nr:hypothetical protein TNCV_4011861 [Trichonephila clavipes]